MIDEPKIQDGPVQADKYLVELKKEDLELKMLMFNGHLIRFKKNAN